jgi:uncharacterized membrane protein
MLAEAMRSLLLTYAVLVAAAALTMLALRGGSPHVLAGFSQNGTMHEIEFPPGIDLVISACGADAGVVLVAAGRFTVLAGPLVALQLMPASATIGDAIAVGDGGIALRGLGRLAIDVGFVVIAGLVVFGYKNLCVHSRRRTMR